jgi:hypothetical protein
MAVPFLQELVCWDEMMTQVELSSRETNKFQGILLYGPRLQSELNLSAARQLQDKQAFLVQKLVGS